MWSFSLFYGFSSPAYLFQRQNQWDVSFLCGLKIQENIQEEYLKVGWDFKYVNREYLVLFRFYLWAIFLASLCLGFAGTSWPKICTVQYMLEYCISNTTKRNMSNWQIKLHTNKKHSITTVRKYRDCEQKTFDDVAKQCAKQNWYVTTYSVIWMQNEFHKNETA